MIGKRQTTFNLSMRTKLMQIAQIATGIKSVTYFVPMSKISNSQKPILNSSIRKSGEPLIYHQSAEFEDLYFYSSLIV